MTDIITHHVKPPVPDFRWDWYAYRENRVEDGHSYGWGLTEAGAVADLLRLEQEEAEWFDFPPSETAYCPRCARPALAEYGVEWPHCNCPTT